MKEHYMKALKGRDNYKINMILWAVRENNKT